MAKSSSQELFNLIQTLSKSEKRYFKLSVSVQSLKDGEKYIELFDLMARTKEYDEKKILHRIGFKTIKQLSDHKNYLYELILKSLLWLINI